MGDAAEGALHPVGGDTTCRARRSGPRRRTRSPPAAAISRELPRRPNARPEESLSRIRPMAGLLGEPSLMYQNRAPTYTPVALAQAAPPPCLGARRAFVRLHPTARGRGSAPSQKWASHVPAAVEAGLVGDLDTALGKFDDSAGDRSSSASVIPVYAISWRSGDALLRSGKWFLGRTSCRPCRPPALVRGAGPK